MMTTMPDFPKTKDSIGLTIDAADILAELHDRQWLIDCIKLTMDTLYFDTDSKLRDALDKIATVLYAYDNDRVTERLKTAITLLSEAV
jgi:hypothetical protein